MRTFKAGDRVRYERTDTPEFEWNGMTGTVLGHPLHVHVLWDEGSAVYNDPYAQAVGTWQGKPFYSHFAFNIHHDELKYDPTQQGDKDEDI